MVAPEPDSELYAGTRDPVNWPGRPAGNADRTGISYAAFREVGVPASVLKQAGMARTRQQ